MNTELFTFSLFGQKQTVTHEKPEGTLRFRILDAEAHPNFRNATFFINFSAFINYNNGPFGKVENINFYIYVEGLPFKTQISFSVLEILRHPEGWEFWDKYGQIEILETYFSKDMAQTIFDSKKQFI